MSSRPICRPHHSYVSENVMFEKVPHTETFSDLLTVRAFPFLTSGHCF